MTDKQVVLNIHKKIIVLIQTLNVNEKRSASRFTEAKKMLCTELKNFPKVYFLLKTLST